MPILDKTDPVLAKEYGRLLRLFPDAIFIQDNRTYRFQRKMLTRWLTSQVDSCAMRIAYERNEFPLAEYMQFYMNIGYSLCGFGDAFGPEIAWMEANGKTFATLGNTCSRDVPA